MIKKGVIQYGSLEKYLIFGGNNAGYKIFF